MNQQIENTKTNEKEGGILMTKDILKLENYGAMYEFNAEWAVQERVEELPIAEQYGKIRIGAAMSIDNQQGDFQFFIGLSSEGILIEVEGFNIGITNAVSKYPNLWDEIKNNPDIQNMLEASFDIALEDLKSEQLQSYFNELPLAPNGQTAEELAENALAKLKAKFLDVDTPKVWYVIA
ncbi:hypothetical protein ACIQVU_19310 [Lysinibacillus sp. NPDC098008]|uniref:hypothetical protein n=1 Tax=Lysinibacillus sp. NPDC098008 TaxID=3364146 RepID=UPI003827F1A6